MSSSETAVAAALARASETIDESRTLPETLDTIVHATKMSLPDFTHVSISMRDSSGAFETKAGTDQLVWELDAVQYDLGEGPCVDAIEEEPVVVVPHLRHDQRWPRYVRAATERGVLSQVAVRLFAQNKHIAGLNLYSTDRADVDPDAPETARLFATHAGILVGRAQNEHHLHQALETRKTIGQAIGIVMERYRIDAEAAFQFLIRTSMSSNIKVRDVAEEVVTASVESYRRSSRPAPPA